jgi:hypothetical protein
MSKHTVQIQIITPEHAAAILAHTLFAGQRKLSDHHVKFLTETQARGEFDGGAPLRFAKLNGRLYLIDGQHRLHMVVQSGEAVEFVVVTTTCQDAEEVAHLYARVDRGRGRSLLDAMKALGVYNDAEISATQMRHLAACAPFFAAGLKGSIQGHSYASKSAEGRAAVMDEWLPAAVRYFKALKPGSNDKLFMRREVAAIGIATMADTPARERARDFWAGCSADDGLSAADPRKAALEYIRRTKPSHYGVGALAHGVAACWNAWFRGDQLRLVKVMDEAAPVRLMGTRWWKRTDVNSRATGATHSLAGDVAR